MGSLSGVVGWKRVREGCKGGVRRMGKGGESVMGKGGLSGRERSGGGRKVEDSDGVFGYGREMGERIKGSGGIRG